MIYDSMLHGPWNHAPNTMIACSRDRMAYTNLTQVNKERYHRCSRARWAPPCHRRWHAYRLTYSQEARSLCTSAEEREALPSHRYRTHAFSSWIREACLRRWPPSSTWGVLTTDSPSTGSDVSAQLLAFAEFKGEPSESIVNLILGSEPGGSRRESSQFPVLRCTKASFRVLIVKEYPGH